MAKKYDTNPLDPDFPKKVTQPTPPAPETETVYNLNNGTKGFNGAAATTEEPTRRYENGNFAQYNSVYSESQQQPPAVYQTTRLEETEKPSDRKVVGLPENILMVLPYAPFYIGLV